MARFLIDGFTYNIYFENSEQNCNLVIKATKNNQVYKTTINLKDLNSKIIISINFLFELLVDAISKNKANIAYNNQLDIIVIGLKLNFLNIQEDKTFKLVNITQQENAEILINLSKKLVDYNSDGQKIYELENKIDQLTKKHTEDITKLQAYTKKLEFQIKLLQEKIGDYFMV